MEFAPLTLEIGWMLVLLAFTIYLFVFSPLRVDVAALTILLTLWFMSYLPGIENALTHQELFVGFSSNAVIAIVAVMIISGGLDKTGMMTRLAQRVHGICGESERKSTLMLSACAATTSMFMQNIGVAALFLPVASRLSALSGISVSRLLLPMGFCTILGGTATMIGGSSLIMLNDLIIASNRNLSAEQQMEPFSLFAPLPIGIALGLAGLLYFFIAGKYILPSTKDSKQSHNARVDAYFENVYKVSGDFFEISMTAESPLIGSTLHYAEENYTDMPFVLALYSGDVVKLAPDREETLWVNTSLGVLGEYEEVKSFCEENNMELLVEPGRMANVLNSQHSGVAEVVIPPRSSLVGQKIGDIKPRRNYGFNILTIHRAEQILGRGFRDVIVQPGDTLLVHASWKDLAKQASNQNMIIVSEILYEEQRTHKIGTAVLWFVLSMTMFLLTQNLALSLIAAAIGMVVTGVLTMDEAYRSVNWQTIFLLASLIPLGIAVDQSGTADWIAQGIVALIGDVPHWLMQTVIASLAMIFSLVMSNVGATTLLVPLAIKIAITVGADPAVFALTVAISTSNAFLIPTNQVNALIAGPGNYKVADFMRAGGPMTIIFLAVSILAINFLM